MTINKQAAFDQSTRGIIAQGGPAIGRGGYCAYIAPNGRKCAAGQLIPADKYDSAMEGKSVSSPEVRTAFGIAPDDDNDLPFLRALQRAHDRAAEIAAMPDVSARPATDKEFWPRWRTNLAEVAAIFALSSFLLYEIPGAGE